MYNTDLPRRADLPSSAQLARSTVIAGAAATALLALVVLPAEYALDPTGVGRALGLTRMGEIKVQLAAEAAADAAPADTTATSEPALQDLQARMVRIERLLTAAQPAPAALTAPALPDEQPASLEALAAAPAEPSLPDVAPAPEPVAAAAVPEWRDEVSFTLAPGQGAEFKLAMEDGASATFAWNVEGGVVNFDTHGDGGGQNISYYKGRATPADEGELTAAFTGNHGWFWRNRGNAPVTVTLRTRGEYATLERKV